MVLLVGAALFAGMLSSLRANDTQFRGRDIVWTRLGRNPGDRGPLAAPYFRGLLDELSAIPGVRSAVLSLYFPAGLGSRGAIPTDTYTAVSGAAPPSAAGLTELVSPGFFDMFGIARLRGRDFTVNDHEGAPAVAIVSEAFARKLSPDGDPVGRRIHIASASAASEIEIVGVVADAPIFTMRDPHLAVVYRPIVQELTRGQFPMAHVHVIGSDDVPRVRDAYTRVVESLGRHNVVRVFTLEDWVDYALLQERLISGVSVSGALLALLLACLGIYGLLAYAVTVRMREIGVRMALGATRQEIVRMIAREGVLVVVAGVLIGISCALALATLIRAQLYGVTPIDPRSIVGSAALFIIVAIAAAALPAWRASRIDPLDAWRHE
jgi:predicted permease